MADQGGGASVGELAAVGCGEAVEPGDGPNRGATGAMAGMSSGGVAMPSMVRSWVPLMVQSR